MTASATNILPANRDDLFTHCRVDCFDGEDALMKRPPLAPEWLEQESPVVEAQTQDGVSPQSPETPVSEGVQSVSEGVQPPMPILEGAQQSATQTNDGTATTRTGHSNSTVRPGWNARHGHYTRYKARVQANLAAASPNPIMTARQQAPHDDPTPVLCQFAAMVSAVETMHNNEDGSCNFLYPSAFLSHSVKDTLHYGEMLQAEDRLHFLATMQKEIAGLTDILEVVPRTALPSDTKPLPAVWAFRQKRNPDWSISKWKARINAHGGRQQHGVNYWETYAPVVNWSTVCLVMILSLLNSFHTRQVDFIQAYMQAPLDCPIYIEIPAGYEVKEGKLCFVGEHHRTTERQFALRLRHNMYGLKQAGHNWYKHLQEELVAMNFRQSKVDKCLFIRADCILLLYVDDCLIFSPTRTVLDSVIQALGAKFRITIEDEVTTYLGLDVSRNSEGNLVVRQPGLIDKVIAICGLEQESNQHNTPVNMILQPSLPTDDTQQFT
jgi:hypothetical protein